MGRDDTGLVAHAQLVQNPGSRLQSRPIGPASHDDTHSGLGGWLLGGHSWLCFCWLDLSGKPERQAEALHYRGPPEGRKRFPLLCAEAIWCQFAPLKGVSRMSGLAEEMNVGKSGRPRRT